MSVSGISSNGSSYLIYLLQQQSSTQGTQAAASLGTTSSSQNFSLSFEAGDDEDDGLYTPSSIGGTDQSTNSFLGDLQELVQSTEAGNTNSAQTAASQLEHDLGLSSSTSQSASADGNSSGASNTDSSFLSDLSALLTSVQSGDMSSAQSAASAVQQDLQAMGPPPPPPPPPAAASAGSSSTDSSSTAAASTGSLSTGSTSAALKSFIDDLSELLQATASGDTSTAQTAATKVQTDLKALTQPSSDSGTTTTSSDASTSTTRSDTTSAELLATELAQALASGFANPPMPPNMAADLSQS